MFESARNGIERTKKFVQHHPILVASTMTTVATGAAYALTRKSIDLRQMQRAFYETQSQLGLCELELLTHLEFLDSNNLRDQYFEFAKQQNG